MADCRWFLIASVTNWLRFSVQMARYFRCLEATETSLKKCVRASLFVLPRSTYAQNKCVAKQQKYLTQFSKDVFW
jgi:hypothetical protein